MKDDTESKLATQQKHNYVIWDASSYFSVKMTEIYVISTLK